jgi:hypothetical protein
MYHLLIERVSTVTIEFLQYRARVQIGLNQTGIERVVERTGLFTSLLSLFRFSFCFDHQTRTQNTLSALSLSQSRPFPPFSPFFLAFLHSLINPRILGAMARVGLGFLVGSIAQRGLSRGKTVSSSSLSFFKKILTT